MCVLGYASLILPTTPPTGSLGQLPTVRSTLYSTRVSDLDIDFGLEGFVRTLKMNDAGNGSSDSDGGGGSGKQ